MKTQTQAEIVPISKIEMDRAEGPTAECGKAAPARRWFDADLILARWARTAPPRGKGYDKCDFKVTWEDGETYEGRYDLTREGEDGERGQNLARHIRHFLLFEAHKPDCAYLRGKEDAATVAKEAASARDFLSKYLPAVAEPAPRFWCCNKEGAPAPVSVRGTGYPMPGDAVRLTGYYCGAAIGKLAVLGGVVGRKSDEYMGTFASSTFRDAKVVSCSGGPCPFIAAGELKPTGEYVKLRAWRWGRNGPGAGNGLDYEITVPLWTWGGR